MRYRQFYIGLGTDTTAYHEHGGDSEANITIWRKDRNRNGEPYLLGGFKAELCPEGLKIRFCDASGELVAELLNGVLLPSSRKENHELHRAVS